MRSVLAALLALLLAGCTESTPVLQVVARVPDDPTLFDDLDGLTFALEQHGTTQVLARYSADATVLELPPVPFGDGYAYVLEGWLGATRVARGRTCALDVGSSDAVAPASLYFSRLGAFFAAGATTAPFAAPLLLERGSDAVVIGGGASERYDAASGAFVGSAALSAACPAAGARHAALRDGDFLLVGGRRADGAPAAIACAWRRALDAAVELRSPSSLLHLDLEGHTLTPLGDGKVLLVGNRLIDGTFVKDAESAWLYDDASGKWSQVASLVTARSDHAAVATTTTDSGRMVMIVGGRTAGGELLDSIETFNPVRGQFTEYPARLVTPRARPTATYVPGQDEVVLAGGVGAGGALDTVEVIIPYSVLPAADTMSPPGTPAERAGREGHAATLLSTGQILLTGGRDAAGGALGSALLFDPFPATLRFTDGGALRHARADHAAVTLCDGTVLLVGGAGAAGAVLPAELYNPGD